MDARFIGTPHLKSGGELDQSDGRCTAIARLFNPATYQPDGYSALNQKCLKRNYDEMIAASYGGPGHVMLSDGCFPKPGIPPPPPVPHLQQMLYRQPYSIPMGSSLSISSSEMHHLVQEPKFPPQTFEIPDIQDSNSVFGDGAFDGATFCNYSSVTTLAPGADRQAFFYGSPGPDHSQCRTMGPSFPGWQQQQQQPGVVSSAGSTNSSPVSQAEEATPSSAAEVGSSVQTQQQVQQSLKINGFSTSHSAVSRLPNKKARSPKRRKRKDPNEPQKPVSAYSLFFRNAQAAIKSQNPSATFGDVSKIVASMWDSLDDDVKNFYKRQMEVAKKEYLKQLAIYRATLVSKDVQGKTGSEVEAGLGTQLSAPSAPPSAPPVHSKAEEGSTAGLGLSPVATSMCMSSSGYPGQLPMSPAQETMSHMMSPPTNHLQTTSPRYYSDGPPQLPGNYSTPSDVTAMRNTFLQYSQKLDHESLLSGIPEHGGYFLGSVPEPGYKSSREYISLENNFINGPSRDIPGRPFVDSEDGPKLT